MESIVFFTDSVEHDLKARNVRKLKPDVYGKRHFPVKLLIVPSSLKSFQQKKIHSQKIQIFSLKCTNKALGLKADNKSSILPRFTVNVNLTGVHQAVETLHCTHAFTISTIHSLTRFGCVLIVAYCSRMTRNKLPKCNKYR